MSQPLEKTSVETPTDDRETGPRNDSSVVLLPKVDGQNLMLTAAADRYEAMVGPGQVRAGR